MPVTEGPWERGVLKLIEAYRAAVEQYSHEDAGVVAVLGNFGVELQIFCLESGKEINWYEVTTKWNRQAGSVGLPWVDVKLDLRARSYSGRSAYRNRHFDVNGPRPDHIRFESEIECVHSRRDRVDVGS